MCARFAPTVNLNKFGVLEDWAWGAQVAYGAFTSAEGVTMQSLLEVQADTAVSGFLLHGLIVLDRGYIFTCMILAALFACLIDRRFFIAAIWSLVGALVTVLGLSHAYQLSGNNVDFLLAFATVRDGALAYRAHAIAIGYVLMAVILVATGLYSRRSDRAIGDADRA